MKKHIWKLSCLAFLISSFCACKKVIPDNCTGNYLLKVGFNTSNPDRSLKLGDSLTLRVQVPVRIYNYASDSIVDISRFKELLMEFLLDEYIFDSTALYGFSRRTAKDKFRFYSPNTKIDLAPGQVTKSMVRFNLAKNSTAFTASVTLIARQKGIFHINLIDGIINDAFCIADLVTHWENYNAVELVQHFEFLSGRPLSIQDYDAVVSNKKLFIFRVE